MRAPLSLSGTGEKQVTPPTATVAVIDYEAGNVRSVHNALEALGATVLVSRAPDDLASADGLILPGVGAFADGMANLKRLGLISLLTDLAVQQRKPFLGICLGMQLMARKGFEHGEHEGLGWIDAEVVRLGPDPDPNQTDQHVGKSGLKIPHVGWNDVTVCAPEGASDSLLNDPILGPSGETRSYYFVHSYHMRCANPTEVSGVCHYGADFTAAIRKDNLFGVQFHPEKSQKHGLKLLENFLRYARTESPPC